MERPLSQLQLDILELEDASWNLPGEKLSEFKRRHPTVTATGYTVALHRLMADPRAWEYNNRRYAPTLRRLVDLHAGREDERSRIRGVVPDQ